MTEILSKAGATSIQVGDQKIAGRLLLARLLWQGVTTGTIQFPDGTKIELAANDWRAMVEFLYKHIDGPPPQNVDITSGGEKIEVVNFDYANSITRIAPGSEDDPPPPGQD